MNVDVFVIKFLPLTTVVKCSDHPRDPALSILSNQCSTDFKGIPNLAYGDFCVLDVRTDDNLMAIFQHELDGKISGSLQQSMWQSLTLASSTKRLLSFSRNHHCSSPIPTYRESLGYPE